MYDYFYLLLRIQIYYYSLLLLPSVFNDIFSEKDKHIFWLKS